MLKSDVMFKPALMMPSASGSSVQPLQHNPSRPKCPALNILTHSITGLFNVWTDVDPVRLTSSTGSTWRVSRSDSHPGGLGDASK